MSHFLPHSGRKCDINITRGWGYAGQRPRWAATPASSVLDRDATCSFLFDAPGGDPDRVYSSELQVFDADWISLERGARAMGFVAVDFDCEPLVLPIGIDLMTRDIDIGCRSGQARVQDQREELALSGEASERGVAIKVKGAAEPRFAPMAPTAREDFLDPIDIEEAQALGVLEKSVNGSRA